MCLSSRPQMAMLLSGPHSFFLHRLLPNTMPALMQMLRAPARVTNVRNSDANIGRRQKSAVKAVAAIACGLTCALNQRKVMLLGKAFCRPSSDCQAERHSSRSCAKVALAISALLAGVIARDPYRAPEMPSGDSGRSTAPVPFVTGGSGPTAKRECARRRQLQLQPRRR